VGVILSAAKDLLASGTNFARDASRSFTSFRMTQPRTPHPILARVTRRLAPACRNSKFNIQNSTLFAHSSIRTAVPLALTISIPPPCPTLIVS
jgi:hypothetical protein